MFCGTLRFRGTLFEKHWSRSSENKYFFSNIEAASMHSRLQTFRRNIVSSSPRFQRSETKELDAHHFIVQRSPQPRSNADIWVSFSVRWFQDHCSFHSQKWQFYNKLTQLPNISIVIEPAPYNLPSTCFGPFPGHYQGAPLTTAKKGTETCTM